MASDGSKKADRDFLKDLLYGRGPVKRFTQDSPVMPDVWLAYGEQPGERIDLLLTPHFQSSAGELYQQVRDRLKLERKTAHWQKLHRKERERQADLAYNQSTVGACLTFDEMLRVVVPLSSWWQKHVQRSLPDLRKLLTSRPEWVAEALKNPEQKAKVEDLDKLGVQLDAETKRYLPDLLWMIRIVGALAAQQEHPGLVRYPEGLAPRDRETYWPPAELLLQLVQAVGVLMDGLVEVEDGRKVLYSINRNRKAFSSVTRSTLAVKADAARLLFNVKCDDLAWAVIDSGIDATHPAFRLRRDGKEEGKPVAFADPFEDGANRTRIAATYDFTRIRKLLNPDDSGPRNDLSPSQRRDLRDLKRHLQLGREVNWDLLKPFLEVPHRNGPNGYEKPGSEHGTHVAGILAGDWRAGEREDPENQGALVGMCPDLWLYDCRVLNERGEGDEFAVIAALQFIRYLNAHKDYIVVHGANLSLSILHDVTNYACGATPVCEECERLVGAGVVVVAAAGNLGWRKLESLDEGPNEGYSSISITDPGNAEGVITVGATHRFQPHTYGVSYFSSRGPTGDGRSKPDLVAPGEKIESPVPGEASRPKDGTSMAAPHVSGAAALLIARHRELAGKPVRIKRILKETATDLGRERYFQGSGMVDVLRALQSV